MHSRKATAPVARGGGALVRSLGFRSAPPTRRGHSARADAALLGDPLKQRRHPLACRSGAYPLCFVFIGSSS